MKKTILSAICLVVFFSLALAILHPVPVHAATSLQPSAGQYREDFNGDGSVSIADVIRLIRMSWEKPTVPGCDYNGDGKFSAVDAVLLVRNILSGNLSPVETGPTAVEVPDSPVLAGPLAVSDCWPECTDLAGWARDVFRLDSVDQASETRKGISFYTWLRLFSRDCSGGMRQAY
ncbi:MAG: dockerin type I domain-containing protein [Gemmatimonadota bacterium]|nr:dockerin type I domain-containing protein [Gemmatimonadota bacterium]